MLAARPAEVHALLEAGGAAAAEPETLDELVAHRSGFLEGYQGARLAAPLSGVWSSASPRRAGRSIRDGALALAVARNYFKLLAYKDEYEVARLYTERRVRSGASPSSSRATSSSRCTSRRRSSRGIDPNTGRPRKRRFGRLDDPGLPPAGAGPLPARHALRSVRLQCGAARRAAADQGLRGADRGDPGALDADRLEAALALAALPDEIRGFGPVKAAAIAQAQVRKAALLERFRQGPPPETRTEAA